ncbi:MAG: thioredoxin-dependent thiol peroxidase [Leptospiraceae bacterium]|nr:thioredoxin-dependent thiol peroxidase [Leptospiraceae bacterium]
MKELKEGQKAPDFSGVETTGKKLKLKDLLGEKGLVLYFYPRDSTPGCTTEACDFRDNLQSLENTGYKVVGVSRDSLKSHDKFVQKQNLNFPLLSDEDGKITEKYGVFGEKKFMGKLTMGIHRTTFLIGADLKIQKIYRSVKVKGHVDQILEDIKGL